MPRCGVSCARSCWRLAEHAIVSAADWDRLAAEAAAAKGEAPPKRTSKKKKLSTRVRVSMAMLRAKGQIERHGTKVWRILIFDAMPAICLQFVLMSRQLVPWRPTHPPILDTGTGLGAFALTYGPVPLLLLAHRLSLYRRANLLVLKWVIVPLLTLCAWIIGLCMMVLVTKESVSNHISQFANRSLRTHLLTHLLARL